MRSTDPALLEEFMTIERRRTDESADLKCY